MQIGVVVSHPDFLATAGVRIRYKRLEAAFALTGDSLSIVPLDKITVHPAPALDVYIFSKTYSAFALLAMRRLQAAGKVVGFDLFDDYFSQSTDSRLVFFRDWLFSCLPTLDFALASTPVLARFLAEQDSSVPTLVLPDVAESYDLHRVEALSSAKLHRARATRKLQVLWFGIGSNPFFDVGLVDLVAYGAELARISRRRWDVHLTVLTNDGALDSETLHLLAGLDCPFTLESWSEEAEAAALQAANVCFLPVSAQSFSRAKSLNRAISALAAGCQVLSPGFPLYKELDKAVSATTEHLLGVLEGVSETVPTASLAKNLGRLANAYANAQSLTELIASNRRLRFTNTAEASSTTLPDLAIIHGVELDVQAHKGAKRLGAISVGSPLTEARLNFDLAFEIDGAYAMRVVVLRKALPYLKLKWQGRFDDGSAQGDRLVRTIAELGLPDLPRHIKAAVIGGERIAAATVLYRSVLSHTMALCLELLDSFTLELSDRSRIARFQAPSPERLAS